MSGATRKAVCVRINTLYLPFIYILISFVALPGDLDDGSSPPCRTLTIYVGDTLTSMAIPRSPIDHYYERVICDVRLV